MAREKPRRERELSLAQKYPLSESCACDVCRAYCARPGWWTVAEASRALDAGHGGRMMLEFSPDRRFGVLSPAFKGNEVDFALQANAHRGCTFLTAGRCELYGTSFMPLECRFCHHGRVGLGVRCHADLERDWDSDAGRALVERWSQVTGFGARIARLMGSLPDRP